MPNRELSIDLGFEREAIPNPANDSMPGLQQGMTLTGTIGNPAYLARHVHVRDTMKVSIFDLSQEPGEVVEMSLKLKVRASRKGQIDNSPFGLVISTQDSPVTYEEFDISPGVHLLGPTTVWEQTAPAWYARYNHTSGGPPAFPKNQLGQNGIDPSPVFIVEHLGYYYFSLFLRVKWADGEEKTYRVDPEMVVTNNGPDHPLPSAPPKGKFVQIREHVAAIRKLILGF